MLSHNLTARTQPSLSSYSLFQTLPSREIWKSASGSTWVSDSTVLRLHKPGPAFKELPRDRYCPPSKANHNPACIIKNSHSLVRQHIIFDTLSFSALTAHRSMAGLRIFISQLSMARGTSYIL